MKITRISVYRVEIPFKPLGSVWLTRTRPSHLDSTVVTLETDTGLVGVGESCPIGAVYLPAFAAGVRTGIEEMAPALLGQDASCLRGIANSMDGALFGHPHAKAPIDIACWDLLGQSTGQPVSALLGGRFENSIPAYASISLDDPDAMRAMLASKQDEGFSRFQIKLGDEPVMDIERARTVLELRRAGDVFMLDANRGWSKADALRAVAGLDGLDCYIEQPCATYEACLTVRSRCRQPMILDEVIDDVTQLARAIAADALDALVIKITHAGGLSASRLMRDVCLRHGIGMRIEDTAGTEIARATQAQLAAATPASAQLGSYTFVNDLPPVADGAPEIRDGMLHLNDAPGLGVSLRMEAMGDPVAIYD